MNTKFTKNFKILLAKQFQSLLDIGSNDFDSDNALTSYIFAVIGRQTPWNDGTESIETPMDEEEYFHQCFNNAIYAKLISHNNSSLVVARNDWKTGTVYDDYMHETNFYVVNSRDQVFKCLDNNNDAQSTDEPQLSLSTTSLEEPYLETSDGYKWKYLYTISSMQKQRFMDRNWMPVSHNKFVRFAAIPGSIDVVNIVDSGNNYANGGLQNILTVTGDGTGAILKANVQNGHLQDIIIQNRGQKYTRINIEVNDVEAGVGSGAIVEAKMSPHDGHGYDPVYELGATTLMFNVDFDGNEDYHFPTENDFRQVFILANPYIYGTTIVAKNNYYCLYRKIKTSPGIGDFIGDEKVYQGTSINDATYTADVVYFDRVANQLYVNNIQGTLSENDAIKGVTSGSVRVAINYNTITYDTKSMTYYGDPTLELYSGKILYIANRLPIFRDDSQIDKFKFIVSF